MQKSVQERVIRAAYAVAPGVGNSIYNLLIAQGDQEAAEVMEAIAFELRAENAVDE